MSLFESLAVNPSYSSFSFEITKSMEERRGIGS